MEQVSYCVSLADWPRRARGERNHQLNGCAHSLGRLVASGHLDIEEVVASLVVVGRRIGLGDSEIEKTVRSGLVAGRHSPRRVA